MAQHNSERREARKQEAQTFLATATARGLKKLETWDVAWRFHLPFAMAATLLIEERLKRGQITLADLTPPQRRALINPDDLDLHAIAAGPIMDSDKLYLPAGKLSMADTIWREQEAIIEASHG